MFISFILQALLFLRENVDVRLELDGVLSQLLDLVVLLLVLRLHVPYVALTLLELFCESLFFLAFFFDFCVETLYGVPALEQ